MYNEDDVAPDGSTVLERYYQVEYFSKFNKERNVVLVDELLPFSQENKEKIAEECKSAIFGVLENLKEFDAEFDLYSLKKGNLSDETSIYK